MSHGYRIQLVARPNDPETQGAARGEIARMDAYCFPYDEAPELDNGFWWIAWKGRTAVGYAGMKLQGWGMVYLCRAGVMRAHRGNGLQRDLLRARCAHARRLEMKHAITDTTTTNLASANNLIRSGFVLYRPEYQWATDEALYWWKNL
jgi:GNAT superfamily N-acetyltransferase